ncbi:specifically androgen-regulated gene protein [Lagopus leucura]|uniref:specifically androgen-regulated gene protein n=1 Tax=Lagopus leucura TaxID=30410 RepID=UPI001C67A3AB|nr:specifically androgen-regulated gene protein [Lagopus leucura]
MPGKDLGLGMAACNSDSCDSMVSTASNHSQQSDNSYDYLSVEEKECLMFLEETIGSLDAEADSGVSTDETDYAEASQLPRARLKRDSAPQDLEKRDPPERSAQQHAADQKGTEGSSSFPSSAPAMAPSPGYHSLPRNITAANAQRANRADGKTDAHTMQDPVPLGKSPQEMGKEGRLGQGNVRREVRSLIIPPPAPFQDNQESHTEQSQSNGSDARKDNAEESWTRPRPALGMAADPDPTSLPHQEMGQESAALPQSQAEHPAAQEVPQGPETKRGPPTAPKPRKLPPNIILRTSKASPVPLGAEHGQKVKVPPPSPAGSAGDTAAEKQNSGQHDPKEREKARREALEKLGLPQDLQEPCTQPSPVPPPCNQGQEAPSTAPAGRAMNFKSNTLERSGVGLGSCMAKEPGVKGSGSLGKMSFIERLAPSFLRSSRPRPASLGAGKDFAALKEPTEVEKSSKKRLNPLPSFPRPTRSCVSVKISPKGSTEEHRREALRKLGLLKE